jgi:hypothetical protein
MPNARNAYNVGKTPPRSLVEPVESRHAIAPAARPARVEIVRDPGATSSRVPHFGHSISFERAAASGAEISALQCGHMRTATIHLQTRTPTIIEIVASRKERNPRTLPMFHRGGVVFVAFCPLSLRA